MEVLLHGGAQLAGWRTADMHRAVLEAFAITADAYSLTQLRYDVRKLRAHGLLQREGRRYSYRLTEKGVKVAAMFVLFHKRVCGPVANTLLRPPTLDDVHEWRPLRLRLRLVDEAPLLEYIQCRYMATTTQLSKWGNSLGLRLPKSVAREVQLGEGDTVQVSVDNGTIVIRPSRQRYSLDELVRRITPKNRHDASDWGGPLGDEAW